MQIFERPLRVRDGYVEDANCKVVLEFPPWSASQVDSLVDFVNSLPSEPQPRRLQGWVRNWPPGSQEAFVLSPILRMDRHMTDKERQSGDWLPLVIDPTYKEGNL